MQEREAQSQPLVRATPSPICAKNPLCHHRPLAPIPARFAPVFLLLLTIPACSAAPLTATHAAPDPARAREREQGPACTFLSRPISHAISSLLYARRPAYHTPALLLISAHPLPFHPCSSLRNCRPRSPARKVHGRIRALPAQPADDAEDRGGPAELRQRDAAGSQRAACAGVCEYSLPPSIKYIILLRACVCV